MADDLQLRGITIPFPDDLEDALIHLRGAGVEWAFSVGQITHLAIQRALSALEQDGIVAIGEEEVRRGVAGKIVAHVGRLVGRSSSRVRRYLDLWRAFGDNGSTGVHWKAPENQTMALNHWEAALALRDKPEMLETYIDLVAQNPTETPAAIMRSVKEIFGEVEPPPPDVKAMVDEVVNAIRHGREPALDDEEMRAVLSDRGNRMLVVHTMLEAVQIIEAALPVLRRVPDIQPEQIAAAESAALQLRALAATLI